MDDSSEDLAPLSLPDWLPLKQLSPLEKKLGEGEVGSTSF